MQLFVCFIGSLFFSAKDLTSKYLASRVDGTTQTFASFAFSIPFYVLVLAVAWLLGLETFALGANFALLVFMRAITDSGAEWLKMQALATGEISLLISFLYLSPVFVLLISPFISSDHLTFQGVLGVLVVASAGLLLAVGNKHSHTLPRVSRKGILLSLGSAFFFSLNHCLDQLAVRQASPLVAGFAMTLLAGLFFVPVLFKKRSFDGLILNRKPFTLRGFFEIASMFCKLYALQYMHAAYVVSILRVSMIFSIVGGKVLFQERDFGKRMLAGIITLAGIILIVLRG